MRAGRKEAVRKGRSGSVKATRGEVRTEKRTHEEIKTG
jgi:hypothetical protein